MPLILIVAFVITALGVGGFLFIQNPASDAIKTETPAARTEETPSTEMNTEMDTNSETSATTGATSQDNTSVYANGTYSASASYITPGRSTHNVNVTLTLANDIITDTKVTFTGDENRTTSGMQSKFTAAYQTLVVGKKIDDLSLSRVGGASLTTGAFNKALEEVKISAQS